MQKDFDSWNVIKKQVNENEFTDYVHEREVWWCSLGINIGFEQDGNNQKFERPVLVLKKFNRDVALVVPLSTKVKNYPNYFPFVHAGKEYSALLLQIRLVSTKRLLRMMYSMDREIFAIIKQAVKDMI